MMQTAFTITHDGTDYGTWHAHGADEALKRCLHDSDPTRTWQVRWLSDSPNYGKAAQTSDGSGNGGQDTSSFFYVASDDGKTTVFMAEAPE